jgi:DNA (cytosine-5)-methyltransferase 1
MPPKIKTLSLFSGAGGLDLGFHQADFDIVACVEIEEKYCRTLEANSGGNRPLGTVQEIRCEDVVVFEPEQYRHMGIECVIGGPPCQTFSAAGRRSGGVIGTADKRGRLFQRYCEILEVIEPKVFVFENVYGLPGANGGGPWREIVSSFSALGYSLRAEVLDAADYGVPQHRERLFMVGVRDGEFEFPLPTHGPDSTNGVPLTSVREAIIDLQDENEPFHDGLGGLYGHLLPLVPEGLNYSFFTAEMGHPEPQFAWRSKFHDLLYKVNPDEPARTIKAQPGKFTGPFHWKNRHFTVEELKRLQSFPDDYEFIGSYGTIVEQIGNSVPPRLANVLAQCVREQILRPVAEPTYPARFFGFSSTFRQRQRERSKRFKQIAAAAIKEQYPEQKFSEARFEPLHERYFVKAEGHFNRVELEVTPSGVRESEQLFEVSVSDERSALRMQVARRGVPDSKRKTGSVEIGGLKKYLGRIDTVSVQTEISDLRDIFHIWVAIERALVRRSRFFSLIDIYGHYANRGDTVTVAADFGLNQDFPVNRLATFVSQSGNCGAFIPKEQLRQSLDISEREFAGSVLRLRDERFDIRTSETHPIIKRDKVISTYPFPLLSAKALVISKAEIIDDEWAPEKAAAS